MASPQTSARGDYSAIRPDYTVDQPWSAYGADEHDRWRRLYRRQRALMPTHAAPEFLRCLDLLDAADGIPRFDAVNRQLAGATGFTIVAVPGLIPDPVFFDHLAHRRFPVTWWLRAERDLDYLVEPDVFHDFFGHVPLLMHPVFADYMEAYGRAGPAAEAQGALDLLARLYWYTIEFGLIRTPEGLRAYGAGILSSHGETRYALESRVPRRVPFSLRRVLETDYRIDDYQRIYFVIDSFDELFAETRLPFAPLYAALRDRAPVPPGLLLPGERTVAPRQPVEARL